MCIDRDPTPSDHGTRRDPNIKPTISHSTYDKIQNLLLASCGNMGNLLNFSVHQFPYLDMKLREPTYKVA